MKKSLKFANAMSMCLILIIINSCTKDGIVYNGDKSSMQKWNSSEDYPFVLIDYPPFEYAVYQEDETELSAYIKSVLEEQEEISSENTGYFILSFEGVFINYGFLTEATSSYYYLYNPNDPDIPFIDDDSDDDGNGVVCFARRHFESSNFDETWQWVKDRALEGHTVIIAYYKKDGTWRAYYNDTP
jgi:hypothetical protein